MRYMFVSDSLRYKKGEIVSDACFVPLTLRELEEAGVVKKVEEKPKQKYKIGDRVVIGRKFTIVSSIDYGEVMKKFLYNGYLESAIRTPTEEEISIYYR